MGTFADWARFAQTPLGNVCLAAPLQPRQIDVIHALLFAPALVKNVGVQLLPTKFIQNLSLLPGQFVGFEALCASDPELLLFDLQFVALFLQAKLAFVGFLQVNGSNPTGGFGCPQIRAIREPLLAFTKLGLHLGKLLMNSSQGEIFALFQILAILQHRGKRKSEGHG